MAKKCAVRAFIRLLPGFFGFGGFFFHQLFVTVSVADERMVRQPRRFPFSPCWSSAMTDERGEERTAVGSAWMACH
jgi:hypothetical protein